MNNNKFYVKCDECGKVLYSEKEREAYIPDSPDQKPWCKWFWTETVSKMWKGKPLSNGKQIEMIPGKKTYRNICPTCFYRVENKEWYHEYTESPYFQKLRNDCFTRDGNQCIRCHSGMNLRAHHVTYENMGIPEKELNDLRTYCENCHEIIHAHDLRLESRKR